MTSLLSIPVGIITLMSPLRTVITSAGIFALIMLFAWALAVRAEIKARRPYAPVGKPSVSAGDRR